MKEKTAFQLAHAQVEGGVPWGEIILGESSICVCQHCRCEFHVNAGLDPCAFCNDCKDAVLDKMAAELVRLEKHAPRGRRSRR